MTRRTRAPGDEQARYELTNSHQAQSHLQSPVQQGEHEFQTPTRAQAGNFFAGIRHINPFLLTTLKRKATHMHIIPAAHGYAFLLRPGASFRIIDLHGSQVVDLMAWTDPGNPSGQHSSMSYTRYSIAGSAPPQVGEHIHSNLGAPMLKLTADTVKTHDMLYMACNPSFYANMALPGHRNCTENISHAVRVAGFVKDGRDFGWNQVVDPFNVFQNTPYYSLKALGSSKAGDYCEFENVLGEDIVVGLSCCPFVGDGFNGGRVTEVAVVMDKADVRGSSE